MSKLIRFKPLTALAFTGLTVVTLASGCSGKDNPLKEAQGDLCCSEFVVGADLSGVDFKLEGQVKGQYAALAQASSDLSAVASGALKDVSIACENIARDLGADPKDTDAAVAKGGTEGMTATCNLASAQIDATFGASAAVKGKLTVDFQPPVCTASIDAQANCEGSCTVDASCDAMATPPKCTGGKLTVECSGSCSGEANASVSCTGSCSGKCEGSCTASADVAIDCTGKCDGTCTVDGTANGASGVQADGTCKGKCQGKCTPPAGTASAKCSGTCEGKCDAKCEAQAGVKFTCDGTCDGAFEAPKCEGGKAELNCKADADCKASCSASASAKAECKPPSLDIAFAATGTVTADAQVKIDAAIASLKANLPSLIVVFKARGDAFAAGIKATVDASLNLKPADLSTKAVACLIPIGSAVTEASANFKAALAGSVKVAGSVGVK